ncbi:MAG: hypothetical protein M1115_06905 [Actinobacteria bacterium]|nr:hypothetical protein [Actinomycetota bacterium]
MSATMRQCRPLWLYANDGTHCMAVHRIRDGWEVVCEEHGEVAVDPSPASDMAVATAISHVERVHGGIKGRAFGLKKFT